MFADLVGFTALSEKLGPEEAYRVATGCLRLLDGVVRRHGGAVDKYLGDALMAVFGYPVRLEQGPAAAVRAALEMQREVASYNREIGLELPLGLYVGINTGPVTAGDIRGPVVREFHVLGDAVNTAARIKSKAPIGHVYVGPDTWEATRDLFVYEALKPMAMKGKAEPVPVFDVRAARRGAERLGAEGAGPLVGREAELVALRDRLGRLAAGEGGVVAVVGPEGIGKSRLLAEATSAKECEGVSRLFATAPPVGNEAPLYLLEPLLETAGLTPGDDRPALVARLAAWLREATARRPLALVFEDLQSAHPASLEILEALLPLARECPLLFVLSSQRAAGPAERLLEAVNEAAGDRSTTLELGPLSALEARRLVETLLGDADVTEPARDLIVERAGGIPARLALGAHLGDAFHSETERAAVEDERSSETERRRSTILFADITGFTAMSEKMEPTEAYPVVAGCLALLDGIARKHGGTVDKYMGDCVLARASTPGSASRATSAGP
jgi:class 3 adenylate cyclase